MIGSAISNTRKNELFQSSEMFSLPCFRFPALGVHVRHRVAHFAVEHQRGAGAAGGAALHHPEGPAVHGGRDQRGRGRLGAAHGVAVAHRRRHARRGGQPPTAAAEQPEAAGRQD